MRAGRYTQDILPMPHITASAKLIWLFLGTCGSSPMHVNVGEVSRKLGMSKSTVRRALSSLQDEGFLTWRRSKGGGNDERCGVVTIRGETGIVHRL